MDTKINIAKILNDKPESTKLWTDMFGIVTLYVVTDACDAFQVKHHNKEPWFDEDGKLYKEGVLCIYPSKSMRDWSKFAWKKGDVLVSNDGKCKVIFERFDDDTYTSFVGKYYVECYGKNDELQDYEEEHYGDTVNYTKESEEAALAYINTIEKRLGGKLNHETLEIEKQIEFKDGDIVTMHKKNCDIVFIFNRLRTEDSFYYYAFHTLQTNNTGVIDCHITLPYAWTFFGGKMNFSTDSEKQKLFDALTKESKAWDAEKKHIVDLKSKVELKPFDKVVVRCSKADKWSIDFFSYKVSNGYICTGDACVGYCLPYNEETAKLVGTRNNVEG